MRKQFTVLFLFFLGWSFFYAVPAQAHRVNVFAWVEGDRIYTTAKFSGGKVAQGSRVEVYDSQKQLLLEDQTDSHGAFSFPVPKIDNLEIIVDAGTGHRGSWQIKKGELTSVTNTEINTNAAPPPPTSSLPASSLQSPAETVTAETVSKADPALQVSPEEIEKIVQKVVDRSLSEKLHPLMLMLAEIRNPDPGLKDILGGLGYILGLVGIVAYIKSRKQPLSDTRNLKP